MGLINSLLKGSVVAFAPWEWGQTLGYWIGYGLSQIGISVSLLEIGFAFVSALASAVVVGLVYSYWQDRCGSLPPGENTCSAGVVDSIVLSFSSATDYLFPFTAQHNVVSIVVRSSYWNQAVGTSDQHASCIKCSGYVARDPCNSGQPPDSPPSTGPASPELQCLYQNSAVCAAEIGSMVGGIAGAVGGLIAAAIACAAIGCATVFLCILGIVLALIIGAVAALIGAFAGGNIGAATGGYNQNPTTSSGNAINVGDLVAVSGNLTMNNGDFEGANVYWFVNSTGQFGQVASGSPEFSFNDAEVMGLDGIPLDWEAQWCVNQQPSS